MKTNPRFSVSIRRGTTVLVFSLAFIAFSACSSLRSYPRTDAVLVTIRLPDGSAPSKEQIAAAYQKIAPTVVTSGFHFATTAASADYVMSVLFTPDPSDPTDGSVAIVKITKKPAPRLSEKLTTFKEMNERVREHQSWAERQAPNP